MLPLLLQAYGPLQQIASPCKPAEELIVYPLGVYMHVSISVFNI